MLFFIPPKGLFGGYSMYEQIVAVYVEFLQAAIPFAIVFGFGNLCVSVILRAAFGGRLVIK